MAKRQNKPVSGQGRVREASCAAGLVDARPTQGPGRLIIQSHQETLTGTPRAPKLLQRFGEALVCVRHRVTPDGETRCTTVELVLEQVPVSSRADPLVGVHFGYGEKALQSEVKAAGGVWDPAFRLWKLPQRTARQLGLSDRVRALQE